ncbi:TPA: hypothetical protein KQF55_003687 [Clostridioides difficile]|nr:hypothetical protein [Clostridioides difficile]
MRKFFLLVLTIFMVGCSGQKVFHTNVDGKIDSVNNINQTKSSSNMDLNLIKITSTDVFNEKSDKFIYFGRETCPICQIYEPNLISVLSEKNMEIYYFDTDYWREKKEFNEILEYYEVNGIPSLIHIKKDGTFDKQELNSDAKDFENEDLLKKEITEFIEKYKEI